MAVTVTNDGLQYLALARGERVPRPFHYRWLWPRLIGPDPARWDRAAVLTQIVLAGLYALYVGNVAAAAVPFTLAGLTFNRRYPVLVDLAAMSGALIAAELTRYGLWPAALVAALVAGTLKEQAPLYAACYAWSPLPLIGLLAPAARHLIRPGTVPPADPTAAEALAHPIRSSRRAHAGRMYDYRLWLAPWGPLLLGVVPASPQTLVTLGLAYATTAVATDTVRVYVWAAPVLAANLFHLVPAAWSLLPAAALYAWPWKGSGQ